LFFIIAGVFWLMIARAGFHQQETRHEHARRQADYIQRTRQGAAARKPYTSWHVNPANQHAYAVVDAGTWAACESAAAALGGHLVTVNNAAEQEWLLEQFGPETRYWIGLTDAGSEGEWRWVTGEPLDYTNWAAEEPNDYGPGSEDYAHMGPMAGGVWNDLGPDSAQWSGLTKAIIERPVPMAGIETLSLRALPNQTLGDLDVQFRVHEGVEAPRRAPLLTPDAAAAPVPVAP